MSSSGDTRLVRGASIVMPLRRGVVLYSGDRLVTGTDSRLEVRFADDARMAIGASSEFRIDEFYFEATRQRSFYSLARGVLRQVSGVIGKRNQDDYKLTTPTGILAIRGTEFIAKETQCAKDGCADKGDVPGLSVSVIAGRVSVGNAAGTVEVPAGSAVRVSNRATAPVFTAGPKARAPFPRQILQASSPSLSADDAFRMQPVGASSAGASVARGVGGAGGAGGARESAGHGAVRGGVGVFGAGVEHPAPRREPSVVPRIP